MKRVLTWLFIAITVACVGTMLYPAPKMKMRIGDHDECLDIMYCPNFAPFWTAADPMVGGVKWLLSDDQRFVCVVDDSTYVIAQDGTLFECNWRGRRGLR